MELTNPRDCLYIPTMDDGAPLDSKPTSHAPGSDGKVRTMIRRYNSGLAIFHPEDSQVRSEKERVEGRKHNGNTFPKLDEKRYSLRQIKQYKVPRRVM